MEASMPSATSLIRSTSANGAAAAAQPPFRKVLIANRGAVAARLIRALKALNVKSVAVYSEADAQAPYLADADESHCIGAGPARESYLNQAKILELANSCGADAIHPGYGFLSENAEFARSVAKAGLRFIAPAADWIEAMGHKTRARAAMAERGMPIAAGSGLLDSASDVTGIAREIGYPLLVKPAAGGGGIGMVTVADESALARALERARSAAARSFGDAQIYLERFIEQPRHIEFQVMGDRHGAVRHLFERDCSLQRRHQKVIEESPAPGISRRAIADMAEHIVRILADMRYDNIGTVEMLRGRDGNFNFLEMNTRLQVEHAVTEMVTGVDLVAAQVRSAAGEHLADILPGTLTVNGHAIEARIYAEDPVTFFPSPGKLDRYRPCAASPVIRIETGYAEGMQVTPFYDPMLAKVIAHGANRAEAIARLSEALGTFEIAGVKTNIPFILKALGNENFRAGNVHTGLAAEITR
jgi:acetyl-CoA carboxylase biotin carboxylase subunit